MGSGLSPMGGRAGRARDAALHRLTDVLLGTGTLNETRRGVEAILTREIRGGDTRRTR